MNTKKIPILMYHQIDQKPPKGAPMRGLVVAPRDFARQMHMLALLGYKGLSMNDLIPYLQGEKKGKVFGITFDDGYENNLTFALPILKRHHFSSTCYIVADRIGMTNDWDKVRNVKQVPLMTQTQLQQWIDGGQEVGSHTLTHPNLSELSDAEQFVEIETSRKKLESMVQQNHGVTHFCYPFGALNDYSVRAVGAAGYITATTTARARASVYDNKLLLPRVLVSRTTSLLHLWAKVFTTYEDRK